MPGASIAIIAAAVAVVLGLSMSKLMKGGLSLDSVPPVQRWAYGAYCLLSRDTDYGRLPTPDATGALASPWGIHNRDELLAMMSSLESSGSQNTAWDLVRLIILARLGVAATYLNEDENWASIARAAARLQASYPGWEEMGRAYAEGRREWLAGMGVTDEENLGMVDEHITHLGRTYWKKVPFDLPLSQP